MLREAKKEINEMLSLIDRMDHHYTGYEAQVLKEDIDELDARGREDIPVSEFPKEVQKIKGGIRSTIGYVSSANLNIPQVKKLNPATNRQKSYPDWDTFGKQIGVQDEITGVIKFSSYRLNWRSPENMRKHYNKSYVEPVNGFRAEVGLAPMDKRSKTTPTDANGDPTATFQDTGKAVIVSHYYLIGSDGRIMREITADELKPYFKEYAPTGSAELKKLGKSDEEIKAYSDKIAALKFRYTHFNYSSIVYVITSIGGVKKRFFNPNVSDMIKDVSIDPSEFISMARSMYKLDLENTNDSEVGEVADEYPDED